jgi:hypothetical protein
MTPIPPEPSPRKNAEKTRGRPFQRGNAGRPRGARNKATLAMEALLDGEAEAITRKAIEMAKDGDSTALRLCMDRIAPARRDRHVAFALPRMETAADAAKASASLVRAVAEGELTPGEAAELAKLVESYVRTLEATTLEERIAKLERVTNQ